MCDKKRLEAHRVALELFLAGALTEFALHKCDNRGCRERGTPIRGKSGPEYGRCANKGRMRALRGALNPSAKLTAEKVSSLRSLYSQGGSSQRQLARVFG